MQNNEMSSMLVTSGWLKPLTLQNRHLALQSVIVHEALLKRKESMDQFCKGLKTLGIHSVIQTFSELMKVYFLAQPSELTALKLLELFSNVETVQDCENSEKARIFLVECIHTLEKGNDIFHANKLTTTTSVIVQVKA